MFRSALVLVALSTACQDYNFTPDIDGDRPRDDDSGDIDPGSDTDIEHLSCDSQDLPGFEGAIDEACVAEIQTGTFNPVVEWTKPTWSVAPGSHWIMSSPLVVQLNDDDGDGKITGTDIPDIVVVTFSGEGTYLRAVSGADGHEHWSVPTTIQRTATPAAADIDGDGRIEILGATVNGVAAYEHDGTRKWDNSGSVPSPTNIHGESDAVSVTDMDGDGQVEIIAGRAIMDATGRILAGGMYGKGGVTEHGNVGSAAFAVDIDGDGVQEVVVGNALYRKDGSAIWHNGTPDGYPAVADFDGDGKGEIVVSGGGRVRLQDDDGRVLWDVSVPDAGGTYYGGPPTVADFDGDGEPEIGVAAGSRYSVFEADGRILWQAVTNDSSSGNTGSTVFDFEGDGVAEVVYADQTSLWVFNGADGNVKLQFTQHSNGTWLEYPVVADVDGDGHAEIVLPHTPQYGTFTGFTVIGDRDNSWMEGAPIWNQHAFHLTNVNPDGSIPRFPTRNWDLFNNFRSSDVTGNTGLNLPDKVMALGDVCHLDCDEGRLMLWTHFGNEGAATITGARVRAIVRAQGADTQVDVQEVAETPIGSFHRSQEWTIQHSSWSSVEQIRFEIDSPDVDCDDSNDVLVYEGPFCP